MINSDCTSIIKIITLTGQKKQQQQPGHPNLIRNWEVGVLCWQPKKKELKGERF